MISLGITMQNKPDLVALLIKSGKLPAAVRGTLNDAAFKIRGYILEEIKNEFTLRNKYTERGIIVTKIPAWVKDINKMYAWVGAAGSRAYLAVHEIGDGQYKGGPMPDARISGSWNRLVSKTQYIQKRGVKSLRNFRSTAKTQRGKMYAMMAIAYRKKEKALLLTTKRQDAFPPGLNRFSQSSKYGDVGPRGFPRLKRMYWKRDKVKKMQRRPWMTNGVKRFRQTDMGRLFSKNAARYLQK